MLSELQVLMYVAMELTFVIFLGVRLVGDARARIFGSFIITRRMATATAATHIASPRLHPRSEENYKNIIKNLKFAQFNKNVAITNAGILQYLIITFQTCFELNNIIPFIIYQ